METSRLPQSNADALPPPGAAAVRLLASEGSVPPLTAFRTPLPPAPNRAASRQLSLPLLSRAAPGLDAPALSLASCLAEALDARWQSYSEQLCLCRKGCSEEAVHELRVATRRLIAQLTLLGCIVRVPALDKARRVLKRRLVALGDLRDTHVQRTFISQASARFPELGLLRKELERRERRLVKVAAAKVGSCKTRKLERWLDAVRGDVAAQTRGSRGQTDLASAVLRATADAFAQAVQRRQAIDLADMRTIHQTRVAFKRFRYMVESLSPDVTGLNRRDLRGLAYYQRKMGIIQDLEVLRACVTKHVQENDGAEALLRPFERYLRRRRARALRSFLKTADRLFSFWPPAGLSAPGELAVTRNAA